MPLYSLLIALCVIGLILWCVNRYLPLDATFRKIINVVVIVGVIIWLLKVFGVFNAGNIQVG